jgi:hypothetical protein
MRQSLIRFSFLKMSFNQLLTIFLGRKKLKMYQTGATSINHNSEVHLISIAVPILFF